MNEQQHSSRAILNRLALRTLQMARMVARVTWRALARPAAMLGRLIVAVLILPSYRIITVARLRARRLTVPARGLSFLLFTHRYFLHVIIVAVVVATVGVNLSGRQAQAQDAGQHSLLYAMVTGETMRVTEQEARPELLTQDSHYIGEDSLLALPDIDFDYTDVEDLPPTMSAVPGTLLATPVAHAPDEPGTPSENRTKTENYVVQSGDTVSTIAHRFGVNVGTILWANARTEFQYLRPGDVLRIPPVSGVLVTVKKNDTLLALASKYQSASDEIVRVNRLAPDEPLAVGLEIILPGGQPPAAPPTYVAHQPVPTRIETVPTGGVRPPAADVSGTPTTKLQWPTSGRVVTQYYGWRHTGLDIDGDYSSPIYASHDGTVTTAGWNSGGYGIQVVVSGNGVMTRYAHASKLFVKAGDTVSKGDVIAMVGTTGRSTGTHLHYEVYINGGRVNPLSYAR
jgi:murein DD-endopeptidase MepM/ murein hydrolase activator NlpD